MMNDDPPPIFPRHPCIVTAVLMLFCDLQRLAGGLGGITGFIYHIISHWDAIRWEGDMFHDLSEVDLGFGHFRRDYLEGFHGDASGY